MTRSYFLRITAVSLLASALLHSAGCFKRKTETAAASPQNLLLITVDGLSPERMGCYASLKRTPTPVLDGLAVAGVTLEDARAASMVSLPAHVSLLSGMTPEKHGIHANAGTPIDASVQTLALALQSKGYRTAAVVGNPALVAPTGLNRGFEIYDAQMPQSLRADGLLLGPDPQYQTAREAAAVTRAAGDLLVSALSSAKQAKDKQIPAWFLWVNYADALPPYRVADKKLAEFFPDPRDAAVAQIDEEIGKLFQLLTMAGAKGNTLVVVAGGAPSPSFAADGAAFRVPLLITRKGGLVTGKRIKAAVALTALPATLTALLHVQAQGAWTDGQDFSAALLAQGEPPAANAVTGENPLPKQVFGATVAPSSADIQAYLSLRDALLSAAPTLANAAVEASFKLTAAYPESELLTGWFGMVALSKGELPAAEKAFRKADLQASGSFAWRNNLAVTLCAQGRMPEGLDMLDKVYDANPLAYGVRNNLLRLLSFAGEKLLSVKEATSALTCFQRMGQIAPDFAVAYTGCGRAYVALGQRDMAIQAFNKSLQLDPQQPTAREALKALSVTPVPENPKKNAGQLPEPANRK